MQQNALFDVIDADGLNEIFHSLHTLYAIAVHFNYNFLNMIILMKTFNHANFRANTLFHDCRCLSKIEET